MRVQKLGKVQFENFRFEFEIPESLMKVEKLFESSEKDETNFYETGIW